MADRDQQELTLRSASLFGRPYLTSQKFWLTGIAFLAVYFAFNNLTDWHEFDGLGITLWSPDHGLSLRGRLDDLQTKYGDITPISPIRPEAGRSRAGPSPRSNGIRANFIRASASS